jgi:hypothetical protein
MKKFVTSLFMAFFVFSVNPTYLFANTDEAAIHKAKTEAEAKELKKQASEEIKKIKEEVKDMKKRAKEAEDIAKQSAALKRKLAAAERKTTEAEAEILEKKAKVIRNTATEKEKDELNKIDFSLKDAAEVRVEAEKQADNYEKNAMINPDSQNTRAQELLKSLKK